MQTTTPSLESTTESGLCSIFCGHATISAIMITGIMVVFIGITTLLITCCVFHRREKEKLSTPASRAVISKPASYKPANKPTNEWVHFSARMESSRAGDCEVVKPLRNLSEESSMSRSMCIGTQTNTNSISDDIFTSQSVNQSCISS